MKRFNIKEDSWTALQKLPKARSGCSACGSGNKIFVFGGMTENEPGNSSISASIEVFYMKQLLINLINFILIN